MSGWNTAMRPQVARVSLRCGLQPGILSHSAFVSGEWVTNPGVVEEISRRRNTPWNFADAPLGCRALGRTYLSSRPDRMMTAGTELGVFWKKSSEKEQGSFVPFTGWRFTIMPGI